MFLNVNNKLVNTDTVEWVDYVNLTKHGYIRLYYRDGGQEYVDGPEAFNMP